MASKAAEAGKESIATVSCVELIGRRGLEEGGRTVFNGHVGDVDMYVVCGVGGVFVDLTKSK